MRARSTAASAVSTALIDRGRHRDRCEHRLAVTQVAARRVDLGDPACQPLGLLASRDGVDGRSGGLHPAVTLLRGGARSTRSRRRRIGCGTRRHLFGDRVLHGRIEFGDGLGAHVDVGDQCGALLDGCHRRRASRGDGFGQGARLAHPLGERGDGTRCRPGEFEAPERRGAVERQAGQPFRELAVLHDRGVHLGDGGGTSGQLVGGLRESFGRGQPFGGGPAGGREVLPVLHIDLIDEQRLGTRQRDGLTRGHVERT